MTEDQIRIVGALIEDDIEFHRDMIPESDRLGHTALEDGTETASVPDRECLTCGHINEAIYMIAEAEAKLEKENHERMAS